MRKSNDGSVKNDEFSSAVIYREAGKRERRVGEKRAAAVEKAVKDAGFDAVDAGLFSKELIRIMAEHDRKLAKRERAIKEASV